jgi:DNA-binding transcriptional LysR family regulator
VVECGSFPGAATRLEMSAVMVGKYIALLEGQLGTRLLERNTRRQSLTDAGRVYFDEARRGTRTSGQACRKEAVSGAIMLAPKETGALTRSLRGAGLSGAPRHAADAC